MFASQLLKILQTIPIEEFVVEPNTTSKETQNNIMSRRGDDTAFGSKERYRFDSSGRITNPFLLRQDEEEHSLTRAEELNRCEEGESGDSCWSSRKSPYVKIPSVEVVKEIVYHHEDVDDDGASGFLERDDGHRLGDIKDELDCDVPELLVCYKDINYRMVDDDDKLLSNYGEDDEVGIDLDVTFSSSVRAIDDVRDDANSQSGSFFEEGSNKSRHFITEESMEITCEDNNINSVSTGESVDKALQIYLRRETNENHSAKEERKKIFEMNSLCYESEVEDGIITFKFNSSSPASASLIVNQISDCFKEQSLHSAEFMHEPANKDFEAQCKKSGIKSSVVIKETKVARDHRHHHQQQLFDPKKENSLKSRNQESINSSDLRQHGKSRQETSVISEDRNMDLSANRLITCIEAMERNGSQSIRSESNGTSMRSFTFPVLKGEWDKSPRKMGNEADERQHKNRISRLYPCCGYKD